MQPDFMQLRSKIGLQIPLIGFYDAPATAAFAPFAEPQAGTRICVFAFYQQWLQGKMLHLTKENFGCGGAGRCLFGVQTRSRQDFVKFLVEDEGLKASPELMNQWIDATPLYQPEHKNIFIGPLKPSQYQYLKSVTFYVNPDQLSLLLIGAQYESSPTDPLPAIVPFGSGCMQLAPLFADLNVPQAIVGATDIAMRQFLPPEVLAFTVTRPMFERLCRLDDRSFLAKPFWQRLKHARHQTRNAQS
ncbi:MAG: DUF169 domain-containing protein [candidate division KSB1 bacterium]|nr:DUF169 domain-containing protein [candidate division KSB1 bacterium]